MDDLAMTCSDFVNTLKMLICSEKHPVCKANYGYTTCNKVVIDRRATIETIDNNFLQKILIYSMII